MLTFATTLHEEIKMKVAIIGGGAAGFFLAVNLKKFAPQTQVTIFEKQTAVLRKVLVSGGGRCNLTNSFEDVTDLKQVYPRGHKLLKGLFNTFDYHDAYQWFEDNHVKLVTQEDHCVFPQAQDAHAIADCLQRQAEALGVIVKTSHAVADIIPRQDKFEIIFRDAHNPSQEFDCVAVTTGGSPQKEGLSYLERLGHTIETPVPSLFTFNIPDPDLQELMGTVVEPALAYIPGTKFRHSGALLITHWGMSGPAVLKLSSHAARFAKENNYRFPLSVNWTDETNGETVMENLKAIVSGHPQKKLTAIHPYSLPSRLWTYLIERAGIPCDRKWNELGQKGLNKLVNILCNDTYQVDGRSAFRDEFVTCGGISTASIHRHTLESKAHPGLFFAGEVLDIDGVTGGFNFQAAWTTAYTVAQSIARKEYISSPAPQ